MSPTEISSQNAPESSVQAEPLNRTLRCVLARDFGWRHFFEIWLWRHIRLKLCACLRHVYFRLRISAFTCLYEPSCKKSWPAQMSSQCMSHLSRLLAP